MRCAMRCGFGGAKVEGRWMCSGGRRSAVCGAVVQNDAAGGVRTEREMEGGEDVDLPG